MSKISELLEQIDEETLEHLSKPKRQLIEFLKGVYDSGAKSEAKS